MLQSSLLGTIWWQRQQQWTLLQKTQNAASWPEQGVRPQLPWTVSLRFKNTVEDESWKFLLSESRVYRCCLLSAMPLSRFGWFRNLMIQLLVLKPRVLEFLPASHPTASQLSQLQEWAPAVSAVAPTQNQGQHQTHTFGSIHKWGKCHCLWAKM